jgi:hypothetical protein
LPPLFLPNSLLIPLKAIVRSFLVLFHIVYDVNLPYTVTLISFLHLPSPTNAPSHTRTVPTLQFWFLFLIFKLMFKGMSQYMSTVGILYFGPFNSFNYSVTPLPPPPIIQHFSIHILISSTFTSYIVRYYGCSIILFSFPSFPKFPRIVPLLQTCSTFQFVYDYACFYVYVYLWIYLPQMRENIQLFCS